METKSFSCQVTDQNWYNDSDVYLNKYNEELNKTYYQIAQPYVNLQNVH